MFTRLAVACALGLLFGSAWADEAAIRAFVNSIQSAAQVKKDIRDALTAKCGTGHCWNVNATRVCDLVAALDVRVDYLITGSFQSPQPKPEVPISDTDVKLMKLIFSQCKPTNYQFWSYGSILHVHYAPSEKIDAEVRRRLGIRVDK